MGSAAPSGLLHPTIRPATADDAQGLASLLGVLGYPCTVQDARERVLALQEDQGQRLLIAEHEHRPIGLLCYDLMYYLPLGALSCRITALSVAPEAQRRGVGRLLLREAESRARAAGAARIELTSASHRTDAHVFYRSCGYTDSALRFLKRLGDA